MGTAYTFILEDEKRQKLRVVFVSLLLLVVVIASSFTVFKAFEDDILTSPSLARVKEFFQKEIIKFTPLGLFYLSIAGGLFFIPLPMEAFFLTGLVKGNPPLFSLFLVLAGTIPGHVIDYILGKKTSNILLNLVSKKKVFQLR